MNFLKSRFMKNTGWMVFGRVVQMALAFVISMITARYLGPAFYGIINYTKAFCAFFTAICTLGLNEIIVKELLDRPERQGETIGTMIGMRLASSAFSLLSIVLLVQLLNPNDPVYVTVAFIQALMLVFQSMETIRYWYQAQLLSKRTAIIQALAYSLMSVYCIVILLLKKDIRWFAFSYTLEMLIRAGMLLGAYRRDGGQRFSFSWKLAKEMLGRSYHFILSGLMVALYGQMDKIMLKQMLDETAVGYYSSALSLCNAWPFILSAIIDSARPIIMEQRKSDLGLYKKRLRQLYAAVLWIGIAVAVVINVGAGLIIRIVYGAEFAPAAAPLRIIAWYTSFSYLGVARSIWLICEGKQKYEKILAGCGALSNLVLNFVMIRLWDVNGAALATLLTQVLTNFLIPFVFKDTRENSRLILQAFLLRDVLPKRVLEK